MIELADWRCNSLVEVPDIRVISLQKMGGSNYHIEIMYGLSKLKIVKSSRSVVNLWWGEDSRNQFNVPVHNHNNDIPLLEFYIRFFRDQMLWNIEDKFSQQLSRTFQGNNLKRLESNVDEISKSLYGLYKFYPNGKMTSKGVESKLFFNTVIGYNFNKGEVISRFSIGHNKWKGDYKLGEVSFFGDFEASAIQMSIAMKKTLGR